MHRRDDRPRHTALPAHVDLAALDHDVIACWREKSVFARSLDATASGPRWTFYEGPPTANGMPGTHHVEARVFKDVFPRFKTMKGFHVPRMAGWDCHGLPVELAVEKELGFTGKPDIEAFGIAEFNAKCRENVQRHVDAFEAMSERMGYWADYENAYWTMHPQYVESVWWALKQIFDKGLLVEDYRVAPYCPRCGTTLSDHELAQGYEEVTDPSVYVRFPLTSGPWAGTTDLLVWTTTPWTLVSNVAVAVRPDVTYVRVDTADGRPLVIAEPLLHKVLGEDAVAGESVSGADMERWGYQRPFELVELRDANFVVLADYVTTDDGTGLVHQAPAFGAEDLAVGRAYGLPVVKPVGPDGHFLADVGLVGGAFFKDADDQLIADLTARGLMFRHVPYTHTYPHCWRCHTPLMYYALPSWYVRTTEIKDRLLAENENTNWYPSTIKHGRYGDWLTNNIDWALSRDRYWGTPLPVWRNDADPSRMICVGSLAELRELSGVELADPHRPFVDDVTFTRPGEPGTYRRVGAVIDAWFDSGSMPFAQFGAPHRNADVFALVLPGGLHLRGDRPDPRLVLHADGDRHAGVRPQQLPQRAVPRPHPGRGRPQDEQASRQHPRTDPADGRPRCRRVALVHALRRLALVRAPGRAQGARGDRIEGAPHLLVDRVVPVAVRACQQLDAGRRGRIDARRARSLGAVTRPRVGGSGRRGPRAVRHRARRQAPRRLHR